MANELKENIQLIQKQMSVFIKKHKIITEEVRAVCDEMKAATSLT